MLENSHMVNNRSHSIQDKKERNPADFPVLGILCHGPAHGYDLCRELKQCLGEVWRLRASHIYALLAGLEKDRLVRHERVDQETRPAKKVFSITDEGRLAFLVWVRSPVTNVRDIRLEFLAKLYFSRFESPTAFLDLVSNQLSVCRSNITRLTNSRRVCKTDTERAALDYRLAMLNAMEAWLLGLGEPERHESGGGFEGPHTSRICGGSGMSV